MKQGAFHRNKTSIANFSRSLFGNLVANSDQLFLPINIFPLQDLVLGVFSHQFTPPNAIGKDAIADALLRHFGSLKALSRASFKELRQFLPKGKAEAVMAALSMSNVADAEHALSTPLTNAEAIYRANLDMKGLHQEVVRVVLLDAQHRCITRLDIARGTVNESLARPHWIFRPAIIHSAFAFALVHNHPSGDAKPSEADLQITKRVAAAAQILQINFLDHVILGRGFFSFQEAGLL